MSLREGCKEILKADCVDLAQRLYSGQRKAIKIEIEARCVLCNGLVIESKPSSNIIIFFCHHLYHQNCLKKTVFSKNLKNLYLFFILL